jgi:hypothetical protein
VDETSETRHDADPLQERAAELFVEQPAVTPLALLPCRSRGLPKNDSAADDAGCSKSRQAGGIQDAIGFSCLIIRPGARCPASHRPALRSVTAGREVVRLSRLAR